MVESEPISTDGENLDTVFELQPIKKSRTLGPAHFHNKKREEIQKELNSKNDENQRLIDCVAEKMEELDIERALRIE